MEVENAISCNCSICMKRGSLLDFVPESNFKILSGESQLHDYQFNTMKIHHLTCKNCGILSFAKGVTPKGDPMIAVNVRCLDGVDLSKLKIREHDGRHS